jgi:hypothetical protein
MTESMYAPNMDPGKANWGTFRGNTLVEIAPDPATITDGLGYPLYWREHTKAHKAPMKTVTRFVMQTNASPARLSPRDAAVFAPR